VYDVSAISNATAEQVQSVLERTVEPASWHEGGGRGMQSIHGAIVVTTSRRLHEKVTEVLELLERYAKTRAPGMPGGEGFF
jgi:hypothetical protein